MTVGRRLRPGAATRSGELPSALRAVAVFGSPIALATALLFYFGWVRTTVQAQQLGYDAAVLNFSAQDYVLRSVNVLYVPLAALLLLALLLLWLHARVVIPALRGPRGRVSLPYLVACGKLSWLVLVPLGLVLNVYLPGLSGAALPASLTVALLLARYADMLGGGRNAAPSTPPAVRAMILVLLAFALFWDTERVAQIMGRAYAAQIEANPTSLAAVTVYSAKDLDLAVPGVTITRIQDPNSAYLFRYEGLRLMQRSDDRYFLISTEWDAMHRRVIMIRESDSLRVEFSR